ncbi:hypothetical protein V6N13_049909 [Hibiscus sabdariffa]|uniref:Uncharacterized protein n=1 Tax=Hibiscus sabdariffa TaxID=183260 RepID=A0ABR2QVQ9_9ROSI
MPEKGDSFSSRSYSGSGYLKKCDVLHWAKGVRNAVQDERDCGSVPVEMRGNARKVLRETGTGAYCISENGQEVSDDGAGN